MDPKKMAAALMGQPAQSIPERNAPYVRPGASGFNTPLGQLDEFAFRQWVQDNGVPFQPDAPQTDYDMRGFWRGLQQQNPRAVSAVNANDGMMHYPDYWKTPQHETFSADSQWAVPGAPKWNDQDQLVSPGQRILYDERKRR
jgi:hypothetical protein